jgi:hypothetical protein
MMQSKSPRKLLALIAMSFGMMFGTFLLPAYGQQEVSPDWYNPWTPPSAQASQTVQPRTAKREHPQQAKVKRVSTSESAKAHGKGSAKRPS